VASEAVSTASGSDAGSTNQEIRDLLSRIAKSASVGNAHDLSLLWSSGGTYIDEDGVESRGRQAIEAHLVDAFRQAEISKIELTPSDIKILGADNAWVSGTTKRVGPGGTEDSRFVMLVHKADGKWTIESATELAVLAGKTPNQLHTLDWLIGTWSAEHGKSKVTIACEWAGDKGFIVCKYRVEEDSKPAKMELQIVGWDPLKEQIVSWHFDARGGFGHGTWVNKEKQWVCLAEGVSDSGDRTMATNVISVEGKDQFTWQSINRKVSGTPIPDTEPISVKRVGH
jgi:uncharacterized protein (TIGR02246 family)